MFERVKNLFKKRPKPYESQCPLNDPPAVPTGVIVPVDDCSPTLPPISALIGRRTIHDGVKGSIVSVSDEHVIVDWDRNGETASCKYHKKDHADFIKGILVCLTLLFMGCDHAYKCENVCGVLKSQVITDTDGAHCHCKTLKGWELKPEGDMK